MSWGCNGKKLRHAQVGEIVEVEDEVIQYMMEVNKKPKTNARNLKELIMELCKGSNVKIDLPHLESYKIGTDEELIEVSKTFQMTRSFSFFRTMDIED